MRGMIAGAVALAVCANATEKAKTLARKILGKL
jgi:hypothetical protein